MDKFEFPLKGRATDSPIEPQAPWGLRVFSRVLWHVRGQSSFRYSDVSNLAGRAFEWRELLQLGFKTTGRKEPLREGD